MAQELDIIDRLEASCKLLPEKDKDINKNFFAVNAHGTETKDSLIVPPNCRVIMFCYSGRILEVCPRFEKFIWKRIMTKESASYNYCTFLANIAQYSSIRNHFCIYEPGSNIKNIEFYGDNIFRSDVFELPVRAVVRDESDNTLYSTDENTGLDLLEHESKIGGKVFMVRSKRIKIDQSKASKLLHNNSNRAWFASKIVKSDHADNLSDLLNYINYKGGGTIILFVCREGKKHKMPKSPKVYDELKKIYKYHQSKLKELES